MRNLLLLTFLTVLIFSCKKETIIENVIIDDNSAPHYNEVTTVQIQNYVNKIYIDLLGREPLENELNTAASNLKLNSLSDASREALLVGLMNSEEYFKRFYDVYQVSYLPGVTREELDFKCYNFFQKTSSLISQDKFHDEFPYSILEILPYICNLQFIEKSLRWNIFDF